MILIQFPLNGSSHSGYNNNLSITVGVEVQAVLVETQVHQEVDSVFSTITTSGGGFGGG